MTSLDVVEKTFYVNVSTSVTGFSRPPLLRPTATELNKGGFHTYLLDEGRRAVLCKGETVVEIQSFPAAVLIPPRPVFPSHGGPVRRFAGSSSANSNG